MSKFDYVRLKNPSIKQGRAALYSGNLMYISTTTGGDIVLRSEIRCHPCDQALVIEPTPAQRHAAELIHTAVEMLISNGEDLWNEYEELAGFDRGAVEVELREMVDHIQRKMRRLR